VWQSNDLPDAGGSWRLVDKRVVAIAGSQRNFALVDFFALVGPTDPLGFLESGFLGTSFSIKNSLETLTKPPRAAAAESRSWLTAGTHYQHPAERFSAVLLDGRIPPPLSETQLQSELQVTRVGSPPSLSELRIVQVVSVDWSYSPAQLEICIVEEIESLCPELHLEPVRNAECLED
jgi:hypothetical protein